MEKVHGIAIEDNPIAPVKGKSGMIDFTFTAKNGGNVMFYPDDGIPYRCVLPKEFIRKDDE